MDLDKAERLARAEELLASLGLTKVARQRAYTLSAASAAKSRNRAARWCASRRF
jgi:predicted mannosyl-3-phosphoglycerate phosphatase (HAD superfamily)